MRTSPSLSNLPTFKHLHPIPRLEACILIDIEHSVKSCTQPTRNRLRFLTRTCSFNLPVVICWYG
jgi:hypothetical protein